FKLRGSITFLFSKSTPFRAFAQMMEWRIFPSSPRRGACAIRKTSRSILSSRRRGGVQPQQNSAEFDHHPVRSIKEASRYLLEVASTLLGEEGKIAELCVSAQPLSGVAIVSRLYGPEISLRYF